LEALNRYDADIGLGATGIWNATIEVSSALGTVIVEQPPLIIKEKENVLVGELVFVGILAVLLWGLKLRAQALVGPCPIR